MSLALTATGFAAWVLSKDAQKAAEGTVEVGSVTEASIEISEIKFTDDIDAFVFEPLESDTTGRVRADEEGPYENLGVEVTWKISNFQIVGDVFVDFRIPVTVYNAIQANYIALDDELVIVMDGENAKLVNADGQVSETAADNIYVIARYYIKGGENNKQITDSVDEYIDGIVKYTVTKTDDVISEVDFAMKVDFAWGTVFGAQNPGKYYDEHDVGKEASYEVVKATLNQFKAMLHGITYDEAFEAKTEEAKEADYTAKPIAPYYIIVNATVA